MVIYREHLRLCVQQKHLLQAFFWGCLNPITIFNEFSIRDLIVPLEPFVAKGLMNFFLVQRALIAWTLIHQRIISSVLLGIYFLLLF